MKGSCVPLGQWSHSRPMLGRVLRSIGAHSCSLRSDPSWSKKILHIGFSTLLPILTKGCSSTATLFRSLSLLRSTRRRARRDVLQHGAECGMEAAPSLLIVAPDTAGIRMRVICAALPMVRWGTLCCSAPTCPMLASAGGKVCTQYLRWTHSAPRLAAIEWCSGSSRRISLLVSQLPMQSTPTT